MAFFTGYQISLLHTTDILFFQILYNLLIITGIYEERFTCID